MNARVSNPNLSPFLSKYRNASGAIFQTYNDLNLAQQWSDLSIIDLPSCDRCAFSGRRPEHDETSHVVPCSLPESLSTSWLFAAFKDLGSPPYLYLAITADDSSTVYYKISQGIVKPPV